jgi:hypothetical protein
MAKEFKQKKEAKKATQTNKKHEESEYQKSKHVVQVSSK